MPDPIFALAENGEITVQSSPAWRIRSGHIERFEISEYLDIPLGREHTQILPGWSDAHFEAFTLPEIYNIATQITPRATWWLAPSFFGCQTLGAAWAGQAILDCDVVLLRSDHRAQHAIENVFHEAWHIAERGLTGSELRVINDAIERGPEWPDSYLQSPLERRARLFQGWATTVYHGARVALSADAPENTVMWEVYSGQVANRHRLAA